MADNLMHLVIIRHGESEWNKANLFTGWTDVDLSEAGVQEALDGGKALKEAGYDFDICYTSYLKRAIHTLNNWKLNERHYGALQGMNKAETAAKYGDEQVKIWRRSFDIPAKPLEDGDERCAQIAEEYRDVAMKDQLPYTECLKDCIARAWPYFQDEIAPQLKAGKRVLIAAHGNSLRSLVMMFDKLTPEEILEVNIPTAVPLAYTFDQDWNVVEKKYIGDPDVIAAKIEAVANQGKAKK